MVQLHETSFERFSMVTSQLAPPASVLLSETEIVYVLVNEAMPGIVKIGRTNDLRRRLSELSRQSGVPAPFDVFYAARVRDMNRTEILMHQAFEDRRLLKKEFFRVSPEQARAALRLAEIEEITILAQQYAVVALNNEAEKQAVQAGRKRRESSRFSMLRIPPGSILEYRRDRTVTCTVFDDRHVTYDDDQISLSALTKVLIRELEGREWSSARGWDQWLYQGEVLTDIRNRLMPEVGIDGVEED
ncbi:T5orf172 domain-containing protein [Paracoccus chinensis]|uniref:T5orf172 domain-containing protein n=1 Tax=Paracoccus chinensis TaxID=525640 RepID=A0A1G9N7R7_9RHOB|nr:T5orf172 domain-containing protein [Paracoccus chinensis]